MVVSIGGAVSEVKLDSFLDVNDVASSSVSAGRQAATREVAVMARVDFASYSITTRNFMISA